MSENKQDPFLVMLELIKGLDSPRAEAMFIKSMNNNVKAAGLLASRDTLLFLRPIYSELSEDFEAKLNSINEELEALDREDKAHFEEFNSLLGQLIPEGNKV